MAIYYIDPTNGNDADDGLSWANAFLTLNGAEDEPVAAGDLVHVGPGVYRELLTVDVSGGNTYVVGTVDVTNGSKQIDGNGTTWGGNVAADYMFHVAIYASGNDGVADGTATFTAAGGNFQAAMIGKTIQIMTRGAYVIGAVAAANSITLLDPHALGWPGAGGGLTYSVMSGQGHYDIDSVDDNTTIQLKQPWSGLTLTAIAYITFNPIRYVADVTGENTDGVGGIVRITGSDNDQATARNQCITATAKDYRVFRGFRFDAPSVNWVLINDCDHWVVEDCVGTDCGGTDGIYVQSTSTNVTLRRLVTYGARHRAIYFIHSSFVDDTGHLVENCLCLKLAGMSVRVDRTGGITIRNCSLSGCVDGMRLLGGLAAGQTTIVENCWITDNITTGLRSVATGEITENYNTFFGNTADRQNVNVGANSQTYPPLLLSPILHAGRFQLSGFKFPWWTDGLSEWSQVQAIAGSSEPNVDLFGVVRPVTASKNSWGPVQFHDMEIEAGTVQAGTYSRVLHDAGQVLVRRIPITGVQIAVTLYMRFEADYEPDPASLPRMIIKQPGQADRNTVMTVAANNWEQLSDTFTPASPPGFVEVWAESRNTAAAGNYEVFYDTMGVA